ncbi:unnamed protein product [Penicillium pancosmium]
MANLNGPRMGAPRQGHLPPVLVGDDAVDVEPLPDGWARLVMSLPWAITRVNEDEVSDLLLYHESRPAIRTMNFRERYNGLKEHELNDLLESSLIHQEAASMQVTGFEAPSPCTRCMQGEGFLRECVLVNYFGVTHCTNCYIGDNGGNCEFAPGGPPLDPLLRFNYIRPLGPPTLAQTEALAQAEWELEEETAAKRAEERRRQGEGEEQHEVEQGEQEARDRFAAFQDRLRQLRQLR